MMPNMDFNMYLCIIIYIYIYIIRYEELFEILGLGISRPGSVAVDSGSFSVMDKP